MWTATKGLQVHMELIALAPYWGVIVSIDNKDKNKIVLFGKPVRPWVLIIGSLLAFGIFFDSQSKIDQQRHGAPASVNEGATSEDQAVADVAIPYVVNSGAIMGHEQEVLGFTYAQIADSVRSCMRHNAALINSGLTSRALDCRDVRRDLALFPPASPGAPSN